MERVTVQTPLGPISLDHSGTKAVALGQVMPLTWWREQLDRGLFGGHGHSFRMDDCDICDVLSAAIQAVGKDAVIASDAAFAKAAKQLQSTPKGALP